MQIIKSEKVHLIAEEFEILNKAVVLLDGIYHDAEDSDIYSGAEQARDGIINLIEHYCE